MGEDSLDQVYRAKFDNLAGLIEAYRQGKATFQDAMRKDEREMLLARDSSVRLHSATLLLIDNTNMLVCRQGEKMYSEILNLYRMQFELLKFTEELSQSVPDEVAVHLDSMREDFLKRAKDHLPNEEDVENLRWIRGYFGRDK
jgi:hypothetical protein